VRVIHPADLVLLIEFRQRLHLRLQFVQPLLDAPVRRIRDSSPAIVTDPQLAGGFQDGLRVGALDPGNFRRDHGNGQAGTVRSFHRRGKIRLHAFGQNVTLGANSEINPIEPDILCNRRRKSAVLTRVYLALAHARRQPWLRPPANYGATSHFHSFAAFQTLGRVVSLSK
jgi:hypothetical protein